MTTYKVGVTSQFTTSLTDAVKFNSEDINIITEKRTVRDKINFLNNIKYKIGHIIKDSRLNFNIEGNFVVH